MALPADTTYVANSATNSAVYTDDLSTVAASFPAMAGVYWMGPVARTATFAAVFTTDGDLMDGARITTTAYFASDATATPDQAFSDEAVMTIDDAFGLSGLRAAIDPVYPGSQAWFEAAVINSSEMAKDVVLVAEIPADTTFLGVAGATVASSSTTHITLTATISSYASSGVHNVLFRWMPGASYVMGSEIAAMVVLHDVATMEAFNMSAKADVAASLANSTYAALGAPFSVGGQANFQATLNNSNVTIKDVMLVAEIPTDTTFVAATGPAGLAVTPGTTHVTATLLSLGATAQVTFTWQLGSSYGYSETVASTAVLHDVDSAEMVNLSATGMTEAAVSYDLFLPCITRN
jgi:hypothetical protein